MLNCTAVGVECILHEHHTHHHGHQHATAGSEEHLETGPLPYEVLDVHSFIPGLLNETDSEVSELSHLDGPNESLYMMCGVLIAMLLVGLIIVLLAVTISKLRKRAVDSDSSAAPSVHRSSSTSVQVTSSAPVALHLSSPAGSASAPAALALQVHVVQQPAGFEPPLSNLYQPHGYWHYPAAHFLYATDQEASISPLPMERPGFCRGMRKNLGGRWKRLVKRKSVSDSHTVTRDHLKQIYVY